MSPPKKAHVVAFTYYSENLVYNPAALLDAAKSGGQPITHLRYSLERCPKTLRIHAQGTARSSTSCTVTGWKKLLDALGAPGAHIELAKGTWQQNLAYTSKSDTHYLGPFDYALDGDISSPSSGSAESSNRTVIVCCGPPKIGKTYIWKIIASYIGTVYLVPARSKNSVGRWIGAYDGQDVAIFEEFDYYNDFTLDQWKVLLDVHPQEIPTVAGGKHALWKPTLVVLLSNLSAAQITAHPFNVDPIFTHRITEVHVWTTLVCPVYLRKRKFYMVDTESDSFTPATTTLSSEMVKNQAQNLSQNFYTGFSFP